jgi:hypothetical protein
VRAAGRLAQGNESKVTACRVEQVGEVIWVPSGDFSAQLEASFVLSGSDEVDGEMCDDGHVLRAVAFSVTGLVFAKDHVQHPMQPVFDAPMTAYDPLPVVWL